MLISAFAKSSEITSPKNDSPTQAFFTESVPENKSSTRQVIWYSTREKNSNIAL
jgi:hypothetical protein